MGPIWGRQDQGGLQVGLMNFAIWAYMYNSNLKIPNKIVCILNVLYYAVELRTHSML